MAETVFDTYRLASGGGKSAEITEPLGARTFPQLLKVNELSFITNMSLTRRNSHSSEVGCAGSYPSSFCLWCPVAFSSAGRHSPDSAEIGITVSLALSEVSEKNVFKLIFFIFF